MILVVEDNPTIRLLIKKGLEKEGFEVVDVENGEAALEVIKDRVPELIISDVMMPRMDGFQLVKEIRKKFENPLLPFIFLTVKDEVDDYIKGYELGADDYLTKPFDMEKLLDKVKRRLKKASILKKISTGEVKEASLEDLNILDIIELSRAIGRRLEIEVEVEGERGKVVVEKGEVVESKIGDREGKSASSYIMTLKMGKIYIK